ncbi:hypothetical protein B0H14DRAFT_3497495 [Mycena olivaceomarginata]|nr:hypothetical protein B0H14DRAFT_3497495 [Mycena olivaceomarginata]
MPLATQLPSLCLQTLLTLRYICFDLNAIKFRTTTYIKIDYSTRQARTRCWREAGPLGFMHRRTGLHRRTALRLAHCVRLGSAFGTIAAARELMNVGSLQRRSPKLTRATVRWRTLDVCTIAH